MMTLLVLGPSLRPGELISEGDPRDVEVRIDQPPGQDADTASELLRPIEQAIAGIRGVSHVIA